MRHQMRNNKWQYKNKRVSRGAFTLVEILVALAIFMLLLAIILVPLNMGMTMLHLGRAQVDIQSASQNTVNQMRSDLSRAIYVYPNDVLPSVTGIKTSPKLPYGDPALITLANPTEPVAPYFNTDPCTAAPANRVSNLSRIDMILPETDNGNILTPVLPALYLVTYYARRLDVTKEYQSIDNPIVLYRAQIPFRNEDANRKLFAMVSSAGADLPSAGSDTYPPSVINDPSQEFNANIYSTRYTNLSACGTNATSLNRSAAWLEQSPAGEPNLAPDAAVPVTNPGGNISILYGSHTAVLPSGVGMATGLSYKQVSSDYVPPKSTFICADTNKDGIIDQVTISLALEKVDDMGSQPRGQQLGLPQVVVLPNVRQLKDVK